MRSWLCLVLSSSLILQPTLLLAQQSMPIPTWAKTPVKVLGSVERWMKRQHEKSMSASKAMMYQVHGLEPLPQIYAGEKTPFLECKTAKEKKKASSLKVMSEKEIYKLTGLRAAFSKKTGRFEKEEIEVLNEVAHVSQLLRMLLSELITDVKKHKVEAEAMLAVLAGRSPKDCQKDTQCVRRYQKQQKRLAKKLQASIGEMRLSMALSGAAEEYSTLDFTHEAASRVYVGHEQQIKSSKEFQRLIDYKAFVEDLELDKDSLNSFGDTAFSTDLEHSFMAGGVIEQTLNAISDKDRTAWGWVKLIKPREIMKALLKGKKDSAIVAQPKSLSENEIQMSKSIYNSDVAFSMNAYVDYFKQTKTFKKSDLKNLSEEELTEAVERNSSFSQAYHENQKRFYREKYSSLIEEYPILIQFPEGYDNEAEVEQRFEKEFRQALEKVVFNSGNFRQVLEDEKAKLQNYKDEGFGKAISAERISTIETTIGSADKEKPVVSEYNWLKKYFAYEGPLGAVLKENPQYCDLAQRISKDIENEEWRKQQLLKYGWMAAYIACAATPMAPSCFGMSTGLGLLLLTKRNLSQLVDERYQLGRIYNRSAAYRRDFAKVSDKYHDLKMSNTLFAVKFLLMSEVIPGVDLSFVGKIVPSGIDAAGLEGIGAEALKIIGGRVVSDLRNAGLRSVVKTVKDASGNEKTVVYVKALQAKKFDTYKDYIAELIRPFSEEEQMTLSQEEGGRAVLDLSELVGEVLKAKK